MKTAKWHTFEPYKFTAVLENGCIETWILHLRSKSCVEKSQICSTDITNILIQKSTHENKSIEYCFGSQEGVLQTIFLSFDEQQAKIDENKNQFEFWVQNNIESKSKIWKWCKKWQDKFYVQKTEKTLPKTRKIMSKIKPTPQKPAKTKNKELERMQNTILEKKQLDVAGIEENLKPLRDLKQMEAKKQLRHNNIFRHSEKKFQENVKNFLPSTIEEEESCTATDFVGDLNKQEIYRNYEELVGNLKSNLKSYEHDFNWKHSLIDARRRYQRISSMKTRHWQRHKITEW